MQTYKVLAVLLAVLPLGACTTKVYITAPTPTAVAITPKPTVQATLSAEQAAYLSTLATIAAQPSATIAPAPAATPVPIVRPPTAQAPPPPTLIPDQPEIERVKTETAFIAIITAQAEATSTPMPPAKVPEARIDGLQAVEFVEAYLQRYITEAQQQGEIIGLYYDCRRFVPQPHFLELTNRYWSVHCEAISLDEHQGPVGSIIGTYYFKVDEQGNVYT